MYSTCLHCAANLGTNDVLEAFPVGGRLAFDPELGRLWVVCRACERWNLSPLDERWEAIEQADRRYRDSKLRVSTDNIGLARLREGLELIRIGQPQRPEMAAWRYGDQFGRRRKRQLMLTGAAVGAAGAIYVGGMALGVSMMSFTGIIANGGMWDALIHGRGTKVVARMPGPSGRLLSVERRHARMSSVLRDAGGGEFALRLEHTKGTELLTGAEAMRAAAQLLPVVNRFGGSKDAVTDAVSFLEDAGGPRAALTRIQQSSGRVERMNTSRVMRRLFEEPPTDIKVTEKEGALHSLPLQQRLALEMALHEEQERRAMEGELAALEKEWRDAENIANIADSMFETPAIEGKLAKLKADASASINDATRSNE